MPSQISRSKKFPKREQSKRGFVEARRVREIYTGESSPSFLYPALVAILNFYGDIDSSDKME